MLTDSFQAVRTFDAQRARELFQVARTGHRLEVIAEAAIRAAALRCVQRRRRQFLGQIVENDFVEMLHRGEREMAEVRS